MTESDEHSPEVAPMHSDLRARFSTLQLAFVGGLGGLAIILGAVLGLVLRERLGSRCRVASREFT